MKPAPWLLAGLLLASVRGAAYAQEGGGDRPAKAEASIQVRLSAPIDYWGKGTPAPKPKTETLTPEIGPAKIQVRETVWAQPIRTPDGSWMLYVPPKPILDFLENPTEDSAKAYLAWKKEQAEKLGSAMLLLGRLKEPAAVAKADGAGPKGEEVRKDSGASLIYFKKPSCSHCISQNAVLGQWLPKYPDLRSQIVLPGEQPELWTAYAVRGTPTLVLRAADGKEETLVGLQSEAQLDAALKRISPPSSPDTQTKEGSR